jgi:hypothetical protein
VPCLAATLTAASGLLAELAPRALGETGDRALPLRGLLRLLDVPLGRLDLFGRHGNPPSESFRFAPTLYPNVSCFTPG